MSVVSMRKMLESGVHFGHQTRRWDPKMKPYIYTAKNGVYIIDLAKTQQKLDEAYEAMKAIAEKGGKGLFVGTKKQAQSVVLDEALLRFLLCQPALAGRHSDELPHDPEAHQAFAGN